MRPPESWQRARVTLFLAAGTSLVWLGAWVVGAGDWLALWGGFIPARAAGFVETAAMAPVVLTPLTAALIHASFVHLAFNLLMLLFCGRPTENILGPAGFVILYVVGVYAAAAAHYAFDPGETIPMVGASGAISAVLGAYAMLFGRNRVRVAHPTLALWLNALWLAAAWIGLQLVIGLTFETTGARIAIGAHIGGFLAGLALAKPLLLFRYRKA